MVIREIHRKESKSPGQKSNARILDFSSMNSNNFDSVESTTESKFEWPQINSNDYHSICLASVRLAIMQVPTSSVGHNLAVTAK